MASLGKLLALFGVVALTAVACSSGTQAPESETGLATEQLTDGLTAHRPMVSGTNGVVTAGHPLASMAGLRILMQGGNAADAAVAILSTLNQVEPMMSGAGGNGFMTIYDEASDQVYSLGATGPAPKALDASQVTAMGLAHGMKAGAVPGLFGGWIAMLDRFGTMSLGQVLDPALDYAENGHPVQPFLSSAIEQSRELIEAFPTTSAVFLADGDPPAPGELLKYPDLARTFRKVIEAEASAVGQWRVAVPGAPGRLRPVLQGGHRANDGRLLSGERGAFHARGFHELRADLGGPGAHDLSGLRRLLEPLDIARRPRGDDAAQPDRRVRPRVARSQLRRGAAPHRRVDQGSQVGHLPLYGRSEDHGHADRRHAFEGVRRDAARPDPAGHGDGLSGAWRAAGGHR